jgi:hypothetical protein
MIVARGGTTIGDRRAGGFVRFGQGDERRAVGSTKAMRAAYWLKQKQRKHVHLPETAFSRTNSLMATAVLASEVHHTSLPKNRKPHDAGFAVLRPEQSVWENLVDLVGFEPTTSSMPWKRAPNCATGPLPTERPA